MSHLTFWGVPGSCAGTNNVNMLAATPYHALTIETNNQLLILDAGTGIAPYVSGVRPTAFENVILSINPCPLIGPQSRIPIFILFIQIKRTTYLNPLQTTL